MSRELFGAPLSSFDQVRSAVDTLLIELFGSAAIRKELRTESVRVNLQVVASSAYEKLSGLRRKRRGPLDPVAVHRSLVKGLPGEALYVASALAFDSLAEALPYFDLSSKTARTKLHRVLSTAEGEQALRLGRVATLAGEILGSPESGRAYLRTPNFALGGATPLELLKTAEGEQLVLTELQTQEAGGPV